MKSSWVMPISFHSDSNTPTTRSANSRGSTPAAAAVLTIFTPCSSVPVRKCVSSPLSRWYRATTSAATVVYTCPRCGSALG